MVKWKKICGHEPKKRMIKMNQEFEFFTPAAQNKKTTASNYPVLKIIAMVFGILSAALFIYYAADYTTQYFAQIEQYKQMGMEIPASTLYTIYFQIALTYLLGILPLIGALLPNKFAKCSILLTASTICWGIVNTLPSIIISFVQGATFADVLMLVVMFAAGLFSLIAAILTAAAPAYEKCEYFGDFSSDYIPEDLEDEDYSETEEIIISDEAEDMEEAVEEAVEETTEEAVEETTEEINKD